MKKWYRRWRLVLTVLTMTALLAGMSTFVRAEEEGAIPEAAPAETAVSTPNPEPADTPEAAPAVSEPVSSSEPVPAESEPQPEVTPEITSAPEGQADSAATESLTDSLPESEAESIPEGREAAILFTGNIRGTAAHFGQLAAYRAQLMEAGVDVLTVDAGNAFGGNTAIISLMNAVPYDLAVPGTGELLSGASVREGLADAAGFRYISSNFTDLASGSLVYAPFAAGQLGDRRVAFAGLSLPVSLPGEEASAWGFREENLAGAAQSAVNSARSENAAAVVLLISMTDAQEETARQIVSQVSGVNAVIITTSDASLNRSWTDGTGAPVPVYSAGNDLSVIGRLTLGEDGSLSAELIDANSVSTDGSEQVRNAYSYAQGLVYEYQSQFERETFDVGDDGIGELSESDESAGEAPAGEESGQVPGTEYAGAAAYDTAVNQREELNTETDPTDAVDVLPLQNEVLTEEGAGSGEKTESTDGTEITSDESLAEDLSSLSAAESLAEDLSELSSAENPAEETSGISSAEAPAEDASGISSAEVPAEVKASDEKTGTADLAADAAGTADDGTDVLKAENSEAGAGTTTETTTETTTAATTEAATAATTEAPASPAATNSTVNTLNTASSDTGTETANSLNTLSGDAGLNTSSANTLNTASGDSGLNTASTQNGTTGTETAAGASTGDDRPIALYVILAAAAAAAVLGVLFARRRK